MKVLSASEAIWPALERTYAYLFRVKKWETYLKLAVVATLSEGFIVSFRYWVEDTFPIKVNLAPIRAFLFHPAMLPVTVVGAFAIFLGLAYCYYRLLRLRFAFVHSLLHQTPKIRASSRLYSADSERFFSGCMLVWVGFLMATLLVIVAFTVAGFTVIGQGSPNGKLDPGHFLVVFFPTIALAVMLLFAVWGARVVLSEFVLLHMALEGVSFAKACASVGAEIAANKETFLSFFLMRFAIATIAGLTLALGAWLAGLIVFAVLNISAAGFLGLLGDTNDLRVYLLAIVRSFFVLLGAAAGFLIAASFGAPLSVFSRSYALFFYGGHYRALGNLLEPEVPPAVEHTKRLGVASN